MNLKDENGFKTRSLSNNIRNGQFTGKKMSARHFGSQLLMENEIKESKHKKFFIIKGKLFSVPLKEELIQNREPIEFRKKRALSVDQKPTIKENLNNRGNSSKEKFCRNIENLTERSNSLLVNCNNYLKESGRIKRELTNDSSKLSEATENLRTFRKLQKQFFHANPQNMNVLSKIAIDHLVSQKTEEKDLVKSFFNSKKASSQQPICKRRNTEALIRLRRTKIFRREIQNFT